MENEIEQLDHQIQVLKKKADLEQQQQNYDAIIDNRSRGRSITVGTAFGGVLEVAIRGNDGHQLFVLLNPPEACEIIRQLSAACGLDVQLKPTLDFSSWRGWEEITGVEVPTYKLDWKGAAPYQLSEIAQQSRSARIEELIACITERRLSNVAAGRPFNEGFEQIECQFGEFKNFPEIAHLVEGVFEDEDDNDETKQLEPPSEE